MIDTLEQYKAKVLEVALAAKDSEGWCDGGFREAMEELGFDSETLDRALNNVVETTITLELRVRGRIERGQEGRADWVRASVRSGAIERMTLMDSDWDDVDIEIVDMNATPAEPVEAL